MNVSLRVTPGAKSAEVARVREGMDGRIGAAGPGGLLTHRPDPALASNKAHRARDHHRRIGHVREGRERAWPENLLDVADEHDGIAVVGARVLQDLVDGHLPNRALPGRRRRDGGGCRRGVGLCGGGAGLEEHHAGQQAGRRQRLRNRTEPRPGWASDPRRLRRRDGRGACTSVMTHHEPPDRESGD